jgi:hypothetical protein
MQNSSYAPPPKENQHGRDRILAGCMALQWMVAQIESVRATMDVVGAAAAADSDAGTLCRGIAAEHRVFLDGLADRLADLVFDVGDYCNGKDMVVPQDVALLEPIFELLGGDEAGEERVPLPPGVAAEAVAETMRWLPEEHAAARASAEEVRLVREQGECLVESYGIPGATDRQQPREWHDGKVLLALADRMKRAAALPRGEG